MIDSSIKKLCVYGMEKNLIEQSDVRYIINCLIDALKLDSYTDDNNTYCDVDLEEVLSEILDYAVSNGIIDDNITERDLFDTKIMGILTPRPSVVVSEFLEKYLESPKQATDFYYDFSKNTDYIRTYRVKKDLKWVYSNQYGDIDITINLSKPEKDPKAIAAAKNAKSSGYPKCNLCAESEGFSGTMTFPARQNHRIIPINLNNEDFFLQYSPYVYYNEHCIVFNAQHTPMKIDKTAFCKLLDFVTLFPHYFVGSNADLPIVGGSILSHDHFQGGNYEFAMAKAKIERQLHFDGFDDVEAGIVKWPMSVIRLTSDNKDSLSVLAEKILNKWRSYTDEEAFIFAQTNSEPHNTITPIARRCGEKYQLDLVLRNNITTDEHPLGVYHPHAELHHIKKENIGLIEVMGLAVLPSRLKNEMKILQEALVEGKDLYASEATAKHAQWAYEFIKNYDSITQENVEKIVQDEIGKVFSLVLEHAGVFKRTTEGVRSFLKFCDSVNQ